MGKYSQISPYRQHAEQSSTDRRLASHTPGLGLNGGVATPELRTPLYKVFGPNGVHFPLYTTEDLNLSQGTPLCQPDSDVSLVGLTLG